MKKTAIYACFYREMGADGLLLLGIGAWRVPCVARNYLFFYKFVTIVKSEIATTFPHQLFVLLPI